MIRRQFLQNLSALFAAPLLPSLPAVAAPVAAPVPAAARFWAIYMAGLHGTVAPAQLAQFARIPLAEAQSALGQLVMDGVVKPRLDIGEAVEQITDALDQVAEFGEGEAYMSTDEEAKTHEGDCARPNSADHE